MRHQVEVFYCVPCAPGWFVLELVYDEQKPLSHRNPVVAWALECDTLAPYPVTLSGLVVENAGILRPDGGVDQPENAYHDNEQEWLEWAHMERLRSNDERQAARIDVLAHSKPSGNVSSATQAAPAGEPLPVHANIHAALAVARNTSAKTQAVATVGSVSS